MFRSNKCIKLLLVSWLASTAAHAAPFGLGALRDQLPEVYKRRIPDLAPPTCLDANDTTVFSVKNYLKLDGTRITTTGDGKTDDYAKLQEIFEDFSIRASADPTLRSGPLTRRYYLNFDGASKYYIGRYFGAAAPEEQPIFGQDAFGRNRSGLLVIDNAHNFEINGCGAAISLKSDFIRKKSSCTSDGCYSDQKQIGMFISDSDHFALKNLEINGNVDLTPPPEPGLKEGQSNALGTANCSFYLMDRLILQSMQNDGAAIGRDIINPDHDGTVTRLYSFNNSRNAVTLDHGYNMQFSASVFAFSGHSLGPLTYAPRAGFDAEFHKKCDIENKTCIVGSIKGANGWIPSAMDAKGVYTLISTPRDKVSHDVKVVSSFFYGNEGTDFITNNAVNAWFDKVTDERRFEERMYNVTIKGSTIVNPYPDLKPQAGPKPDGTPYREAGSTIAMTVLGGLIENNYVVGGRTPAIISNGTTIMRKNTFRTQGTALLVKDTVKDTYIKIGTDLIYYPTRTQVPELIPHVAIEKNTIIQTLPKPTSNPVLPSEKPLLPSQYQALNIGAGVDSYVDSKVTINNYYTIPGPPGNYPYAASLILMNIPKFRTVSDGIHDPYQAPAIEGNIFKVYALVKNTPPARLLLKGSSKYVPKLNTFLPNFSHISDGYDRKIWKLDWISTR